jgi:hypothetical protein
VGLRLDTRSVVVVPFAGRISRADDWRPLRAYYDGMLFTGWWRQADNVVRTMVSCPASAAPLTSIPTESRSWSHRTMGSTA